MQNMNERTKFRNSKLPNIFDARDFKLLIRRFFGPSLAPPTEPMKPADVARLLSQSQTDKPALEKSGARK